MGRMFGWLMVAVLAGALAGCKPSDAIKQGKVIDNGTKTEERAATPSAPLDPATLGAVRGTDHLSGKAPARVKIDMSQDPVCSMMGFSYGSTHPTNFNQKLNSAGRKRTLYVTVKWRRTNE